MLNLNCPLSWRHWLIYPRPPVVSAFQTHSCSALISGPTPECANVRWSSTEEHDCPWGHKESELSDWTSTEVAVFHNPFLLGDMYVGRWLNYKIMFPRRNKFSNFPLVTSKPSHDHSSHWSRENVKAKVEWKDLFWTDYW